MRAGKRAGRAFEHAGADRPPCGELVAGVVGLRSAASVCGVGRSAAWTIAVQCTSCERRAAASAEQPELHRQYTAL